MSVLQMADTATITGWGHFWILSEGWGTFSLGHQRGLQLGR